MFTLTHRTGGLTVLKRTYTHSMEITPGGDILLPTGSAITIEQLHLELDKVLDYLEKGRSGQAQITMVLLMGGKR
jgi:hypothetical protein